MRLIKTTALFLPALLGAQAQTTLTFWPINFPLTVNWSTHEVDGNRQASVTVTHSDASHPCTAIGQIAITDSAHAAGGGALKWLDGGGKCDFGSGISSGQFYVLASSEFPPMCVGKTGFTLYRKVWLSMFAITSAFVSPSARQQQLIAGPSAPFIGNYDGYKELTLNVSVTCVGPPPPPPPPPPTLTITNVVVTHTPIAYSGKCPATVTFFGNVNVNITGGAQTRFEFSDGTNSPTALVHINPPGGVVSYARIFPKSASGSVRLHANNEVSGSVSYSVNCKP